jgi:hypothetical protein
MFSKIKKVLINGNPIRKIETIEKIMKIREKISKIDF